MQVYFKRAGQQYSVHLLENLPKFPICCFNQIQATWLDIKNAQKLTPTYQSTLIPSPFSCAAFSPTIPGFIRASF